MCTANVAEDQHIDVTLLRRKLNVDGEHWEPRCRFPKVEEDVLLYLAVEKEVWLTTIISSTRIQPCVCPRRIRKKRNIELVITDSL